MLCFRCEHRAKFFEQGSRPRHECGEIQSSKIACYMYRPARPVILKSHNANDPRPEHGGYFGCRMEGVAVANDIDLAVKELGNGMSLEYWTPKESTTSKQTE